MVGGANIDITAQPEKKLCLHDSIPGNVTWGLGGVARNICENLSKLNQNIEFISVFGVDQYSEKIKKDCREKNINLNYSEDLECYSTPTYICLNDENGEMVYAVSDMSVYANITPEFLEKRMNVINRSKVCVFDTNIPQDSIEYLINNSQVPLFAEAVSKEKVKKLKNKLSKIYSVKLNLIEAGVLSEIKIKDENTLQAAAAVLLSQGLNSVFITLGEKGTYYSSKQESGIIPCFKGPVINTTGAGDSFMAGLIFSYMKKEISTKVMARYGTAAAALTVSSKFSVSENMSCENIKGLISKIKKGNCF